MELVIEIHLLLDAVFVQRVQNRVAGAGSSITSAAHRALAIIASVTAEGSLGDFAILGPTERHAKMLKFINRLRCVKSENLLRVLVAEVIATFDGVVPVPDWMVLFFVAERGADPALGGTGVAAGWEELRDHRYIGSGRSPIGGVQAGGTGTNDHNIMAQIHGRLSAGWLSEGWQSRQGRIPNCASRRAVGRWRGARPGPTPRIRRRC